MLKRPITYKNFNDQQVTREVYFHISLAEMIELEASVPGGFRASLMKIIQAEDSEAIVNEVKRFILMAYGQKSQDGESFVKSEVDRTAFSQTAAYQALFMELATDADKAADFINGIFPPELVAAAQAEQAKTQIQVPAPVVDPIFGAMQAAATDRPLPFPPAPPTA
jgi:hypothetical protein